MASTINALTGSGGVATTADSSGVLDLQSAGTTIATVSSAGIAMASGKTLTGDAVSNGKILQVLASTERGVITFTGALADALTINITPSSTSSKIWVHWDTVFGRIPDNYGAIYLYRGGSVLTNATSSAASGVQPAATNAVSNSGSIAGDTYFTNQHSGSFLDSPNTTSAVTYAIKAQVSYGSNIFLNRPQNDTNSPYIIKTVSTITVMEVGA